MQSHHLQLAKKYWVEHLQPGDVVIDATCGNGQDTLFLTTLSAQVFALDIQHEALRKTKELVPNATLFQFSHELIAQVPVPKLPRLIVYNLGYLPGGDKAITTKCETTLKSIENSLLLLAPDGALSITCYPGHAEGKIEETAVITLLSQLNPCEWLVYQHKYLNRPHSPVLMWVRRQTLKDVK